MLPMTAAASPVVGYNRYMYGLAVFHASTRASVTAADLTAKLGVTASQASAMMSEMAARGVLSTAGGMVSATVKAPARKPYIRKALRKLEDLILSDPPREESVAKAPGNPESDNPDQM